MPISGPYPALHGRSDSLAGDRDRGLATSVSAVVDAPFLAPLPYSEPDPLVEIGSTPAPTSVQRVDYLDPERIRRWSARCLLSPVATCSYNFSMRAVGIRELKNKLSQYVRLVEAGESVLVTDRGTVVAELRPPGAATEAGGREGLAPGLLDLARRGRAVPGAPHDPALYECRSRALPSGSLAELLDAERADE